MGGRTLTSTLSELRTSGAGDLPLTHVVRLLDTVDQSLLVSERNGKVVLANSPALESASDPLDSPTTLD